MVRAPEPELLNGPFPSTGQRAALIRLTLPARPGLSFATLRTADETAAPGPCVNQEVRTLMTVVAVGAAHKPKCIVPTPVAAG